MRYPIGVAAVAVLGLVALPAYGQRGGGGGRMSGGFSGRSAGHFSSHFPGRATGSRAVFRGIHMPPVRGRGIGPPPAGMVSRGGAPTQIPHPLVVSREPLSPTRVFPVVPHRFHTAPFVEFAPLPLNHRFVFFHHGFGFSSCSSLFGFGFPRRHFFFNSFFNCFPEPFFDPVSFEPFFVPAAEPFLSGAPPPESGTATPQETNGEASQSDAGAFDSSYIEEKGPATEAPTAAAPGAERPLTLLQLQDGTMYGLTAYWVEGNHLHYRTSYGGENSVPFEQIDLDKTIELNAERGVEFTLRGKPDRSKP